MNLNIFNSDQKEQAITLFENPVAKFSDLTREELKELAIVWCYYSAKIEGNRYSYVETEMLFKDGLTAVRPYEDAIMLKNLHNVFMREIDTIEEEGDESAINEKTLCHIHTGLTKDLLPVERLGVWRNHPVRISGTAYVPEKDILLIKRATSEVLETAKTLDIPVEKAVFLHCNLARIQPFSDGNKRTSRTVESLVLMKNDLIPTYSTDDKDILEYRNALVTFYETEDYTPYVDYFLRRQQELLMEIAAPAIKHSKRQSRGKSL